MFAFIVEEHLETSTEEVSWRHSVVRRTYVNSTVMLRVSSSLFCMAIFESYLPSYNRT